MKTLETERLLLREWAPGDIGDLYEYASNPNVGPNAGWKPHASASESMGVLQMFIEQNADWAIVHKADNKVIGSLGMHADPKRLIQNARLMGYVLAEEYWGIGIATEAARRAVQYAFEELRLDVLSIGHYPFNLRSRRVIEKCGFQYEGTLRHAMTIYDGSVHDLLCYSILKNEYFAAKG